MELLAKIKIDNVYKSKDFNDKKSGEVKVGKWKLQTFEEVETEQGVQMKLFDISVPEEVGLKFKDKIGDTVTIPVATYVNNGRIGFYGI